MPRCYLLTVCAGSSLDQHSNNVTLFNLVEQVNVPPGAPPPPGGIIPLEVHAYFELAPEEYSTPFEVRFALVADTGLETFSDVFAHKSVTLRYRTRTLGVPFPPVVGQYHLCLDCRLGGTTNWSRQAISWPIAIVEIEQRPIVTH